MRFNELHRSFDGISQTMLTVTVRKLEQDGLLIRTVYPTIPPLPPVRIHGRVTRKAEEALIKW
jgi:DNA-binding HxlR family transcriptional regulator